MGEERKDAFRLDFDRKVKVKFHGMHGMWYSRWPKWQYQGIFSVKSLTESDD